MDQNILVTEQINEGRAIVDLCLAEGVDVTAAFWVNPSDDGRWCLYIATKLVEDQGIFAAYKAVLSAMRKLSTPSILDPLVGLRLVGATSPITAEVLDVQRRYSTAITARYHGNRLGNLEIAEAHIYPPRHPAQAAV